MTTLADALQGGRGNERPFRCTSHEDKHDSASVNVLKGVWYCPTPEVRLLTSDLRWQAIGETQIGDTLVGFDENLVVDGKRQWRTATVDAVQRIMQPCYDILLSDGKTVRASAGHQWLVEMPGNGHRQWRTTAELVSRNGGYCKIMRVAETWELDTSREAGYLAAAFDGEGCLLMRERGAERRGREVRLVFYQRDNQMLAKVERCLTTKGFSYGKYFRDDGVWQLLISRKEEVLRFLGQIRPQRLLSKFSPELMGGMSRLSWASVVGLIDVGAQEVIAMKTSTGTYVAEGLASHNCYACHASGSVDTKKAPSASDLAAMLEPEQVARHYPDAWLELFGTGGYWLTRFPDWLCYIARLGQDPFTGDGTFPVYTPAGTLAGIGRRKKDGQPKYLYPPRWAASKVLHGMHMLGTSDHVVLVEGAADQTSLLEVGIPALACYGSGLHLPQRELLLRGGYKHILLGFDTDAAGQMAATRTEELLQQVNKPTQTITWSGNDPGELEPAQRQSDVETVVGGLYREQWQATVDRMIDHWKNYLVEEMHG